MVFTRCSRGGQTHARRANSYFKIVFLPMVGNTGPLQSYSPWIFPWLLRFFMLSEPARVSAKRAEAIFNVGISTEWSRVQGGKHPFIPDFLFLSNIFLGSL